MVQDLLDFNYMNHCDRRALTRFQLLWMIRITEERDTIETVELSRFQFPAE